MTVPMHSAATEAEESASNVRVSTGTDGPFGSPPADDVTESPSKSAESAESAGSPQSGSAGTTSPEEATSGSTAAAPGHRWWIPALSIAILVVFGVILWGGYTEGWEWTGVNDKDTMWHWLQILLVPIAFAALPLVLRERQAMRPERKALMAVLLIAFVAFVIIGYAVPLDWTGFTGNTLWDWLELMLLPVAITSVRFLRAERTLTWAHYTVGAVLLIAFLVFVTFGYLAPWEWTGFTGNTALDWIQLLILPVLFPTIVVPAAAAWLTARREDRRQDRLAAADAADASDAADAG